QQRGTLSEEEAAQYLSKIARNLDHVHRQNVIHRDIKPANIVLNSQGKPVLVDFGLATTLGTVSVAESPASALPHGTSRTVIGQVAGTPGYIAPECFSSPYPVSAASDVFSLGVTMYELLTGSLPFTTLDELLAHREADRMQFRKASVA